MLVVFSIAILSAVTCSIADPLFLYTKLGQTSTSQSIAVTTSANHTISRHEQSGEVLESTCPTWYYRTRDGSCSCGDVLNGAIICSLDSNERVSLAVFYCMTYSEDSTDTVAGACLYSYFSGSSKEFNYVIPQNVSELNEMMCGFLNRDGQLCGGCKEGFAPPVYSYDLQCVEASQCTHHSTWWKYLIAAFLPLTIFYITVIVFRISATSPAMNGFVLVSQILLSPFFIRIFELDRRVNPENIPTLSLDIVASVYGIWNLDFFRTVYTPFCLHPEMTNIQALALDYVIAVYPLILITATYFLVELHDWGFRPIIWLWKPFHRCFVRFRRQWDIRTSLLDAFATFLLLSYIKLLSVSFDLLFPVSITDVYGHTFSSMYLYSDATVEYFGNEHLPYGIMAGVILAVFIICPVVLLCLYPCRCFQRFLNKCRFQCRLLHMFMDVFQGGYKDGTNGTRDCRYFAAVYLMVRIATFVFLALTLSNVYLTLVITLFIILAISVALIRPYKSNVYNIVDSILLLMPVFGYISLMQPLTIFTQINIFQSIGNLLGFIALVVPVLYITGVLFYRLCIIVCCKHRRVQTANSEESLPDRLIHAQSYPPP